jgi:intein/homing endonuclease
MRYKIIFNKKDLEDQYKRLKTIENVAHYFDVSVSTIRKNFKYFDITFSKINKLKLNDNFFGADSPESFYIAGFIAADGCVNNKELSIRLSSKDKKHLEKINSILQSERSIRHYNNNYTGVSVLRICSKQILNDLKRFNVVPRKSLIYSFPDWIKNHPLKNHFMRGYFDGDGSFYLQHQYNKKICFGLRGTVKFLIDYRSILEKECEFPVRINAMPISGGCGLLGYGGNKNIIKISNFLYKDATIYLDRKKKIALKAEGLLK